MEYRRCGRSGLKLPAISLGLWHNFGGGESHDAARDMIVRAFDLGVTHFDLANNYGPPPGSAEECLGRVLRSDLAGYRDELIISTKAGYFMWPGPYGEWGGRKSLLASLDQSLLRMGIPYVDIFYSHRYDPETPLEETASALSHSVRCGKALYVGISSYPAEQTRAMAELLRQAGTPLVIHQPRYNLLDRWIENGLVQVLSEVGAGTIAFCPLAQGLLTNRYVKGIAPDSRATKPHGFLKPADITEESLTRVRRLSEIAASREQSLAQMALAWTLARPGITSALIGASRVSQIEENVRALERPTFSVKELEAIDLACAAKRAF